MISDKDIGTREAVIFQIMEDCKIFIEHDLDYDILSEYFDNSMIETGCAHYENFTKFMSRVKNYSKCVQIVNGEKMKKNKHQLLLDSIDKMPSADISLFE